MRALLTTITLTVSFVVPLVAASAEESCEALAHDKKLAGAALTDFMNKCEKDTKSARTKPQTAITGRPQTLIFKSGRFQTR
jgi:hypothetical protein